MTAFKSGDTLTIDSTGICICVEHVFPARDKQEETPYLPARPAVPESYMVSEVDGPTPGVTWVATGSFLSGRCTRVHKQEEDKPHELHLDSQ